MPYTVLQENSGTLTATSGQSASLGSATTAGTTVILVLGSNNSSPTLASLTGWTLQSPSSTALRVYTRVTAGGETSWALTESLANAANWLVFEVDGLDTSSLVDVKPTTISSGTGTTSDTFTSGTNPMSTVYDGLGLAVHNANNTTSATQPVWSAIGSGFTQELQQATTVGATAVGTSVSLKAMTGPVSLDVAGTSSVNVLFANTHIVFACAGARRAPMFDAIAGFEWGTTAGFTGVNGQTPFDGIAGAPAIVTTSPRTGSYCLELSSSAAAEAVSWSAGGALGLYGSLGASLVVRAAVLFPSSLPAGDLPLMSAETGSGLAVRYVSASQAFGVKVGTGTEQLSAALSPDTWYGLDLRMVASTTAATIDWQVNGVDQTQATGTTGTALINGLTIGWATAQTATVRFDDIAVSKVAGQYPIGDIRVYPLLADPAGTVTITGTASNFQTMSANGTLAAWNATTARNAVDEIPPTIGATADGLVQSTLAASDFVEVPMQTRDAATNGQSIKAVRWYFPGWAASATANTIGFRAFDGTTETILWATANPTFTNSTTTPGWVCRMHRTLGVTDPRTWAQAQLDALTARIGFSSDATPAVGVHAVLAEVAMRAGQTQTMFGAPGDVQVTASNDPDSAGLISLTTQGADYKGVGLTYDVSGTPTNATVTPGGNRTDTIGAADSSVVDYVAIYPDPEGVADT